MAELLEDIEYETSSGTIADDWLRLGPRPTIREYVEPTRQLDTILAAEPDTPLYVQPPVEVQTEYIESKEALEADLREIIESGEVPTVRQADLRQQEVVDAVPPLAELEAEQAEQEEFAGIFLEQQQTISSLDSILREKAAEPGTTGTLYMQPPPPGSTGTNFALLAGIGLGLWMLMKMKK